MAAQALYMAKQPLFYGNPYSKEEKAAAALNGMPYSEWVTRIKQDIAARNDITEEQKVLLAVATLRADASSWWEDFSTMNPALQPARREAKLNIQAFLRLFAMGFGTTSTGYDGTRIMSSLHQLPGESPYQFLMRTTKGLKTLFNSARLDEPIAPIPVGNQHWGAELTARYTALKDALTDPQKAEFDQILMASATRNISRAVDVMKERHNLYWINAFTLEGLKDRTAADKLRADLRKERNDFTVLNPWNGLQERSAMVSKKSQSRKEVAEVHTQDEEANHGQDGTDTGEVDGVQQRGRGRGRGRGKGGRGKGRGKDVTTQPPTRQNTTDGRSTQRAKACVFCNTADHDINECTIIKQFAEAVHARKQQPNAQCTQVAENTPYEEDTLFSINGKFFYRVSQFF